MVKGPLSKVRLVGAWHYSSDGSIDGINSSLTLSEFLAKGTPATVIVSHGAKRVQKIYSAKEAQKFIQDIQANMYLNEIR